MNPHMLGATTGRVLRQLKSDPRSIAMIVVLPAVLLTIIKYVFADQASPGVSTFDRIGPIMLGVFPFVVMFLITSITMLRERVGGTLERLMASPIGKADLLFGYALAFSAAAVVQALVACGVGYWLLDLHTDGSAGYVVLVAVINAILGVALGLLCSAFAHTEFQAVQFMPVVVIPQFLVCGLLIPRDQMADWLHAFSNVMPMTYSVQSLTEITTHVDPTGLMWRDVLIVLACAIAALALAAVTMKRRTK